MDPLWYQTVCVEMMSPAFVFISILGHMAPVVTVSYSDDTVPPVERIFRWLDLEGRLCLDPNKILLPTCAPSEDQPDPELEDLHLHLVEWTSLFHLVPRGRHDHRLRH